MNCPGVDKKKATHLGKIKKGESSVNHIIHGSITPDSSNIMLSLEQTYQPAMVAQQG